MKKCEAPIDNKNLLEDPFEDEVFGELMQAYDHRDGSRTRHLVGTKQVKDDKEFIDACGIVDVRWKRGDNCVHITLLAVSGCANSNDWEDVRRYIFDDYRNTLKAWECPDNHDLRVEFYELKNQLNVMFYFETDN